VSLRAFLQLVSTEATAINLAFVTVIIIITEELIIIKVTFIRLLFVTVFELLITVIVI